MLRIDCKNIFDTCMILFLELILHHSKLDYVRGEGEKSNIISIKAALNIVFQKCYVHVILKLDPFRYIL